MIYVWVTTNNLTLTQTNYSWYIWTNIYHIYILYINKNEMKNNVNFSNLKAILYEGCPDVLTDKDIRTIQAQQELEVLYSSNKYFNEPIVPELAAEVKTDRYLEWIAERIHNTLNPINEVWSTVKEPILDEYNMLYKVEGIDTDLLFATLQLRQQIRWVQKETHNNLKLLEEDIVFNQDKVSYKGRDIERLSDDHKHQVIENRAQRGDKQHNIIMNVEFDWDPSNPKDDWLIDLNPNYKESKVDRKFIELQSNLKFKLATAWKDYHHRQAIKAKALWVERVKANKQIQDLFIQIRRYQGWLERLERYNFDKVWNDIQKDRTKKYEYYLWKFVDWQQAKLENGIDPELTREEACSRINFPTSIPAKPEFKPSWLKDKEKLAKQAA